MSGSGRHPDPETELLPTSRSVHPLPMHRREIANEGGQDDCGEQERTQYLGDNGQPSYLGPGHDVAIANRCSRNEAEVDRP